MPKEGNQKGNSHYDCLHLQPARGGAALMLILRKDSLSREKKRKGKLQRSIVDPSRLIQTDRVKAYYQSLRRRQSVHLLDKHRQAHAAKQAERDDLRLAFL